MVLDALSSQGADILEIFPNFYNYNYSGFDVIEDTNMYRPYSYGNMVSFEAGRCYFFLIEYGADYKCPGSPTIFGTRKSKPFFAVATILNFNRESSEYSINLDSELPYMGAGEETNLQKATIINRNLKLQYETVQYRNSSFVTIGEFYFVVSNEKDWNSIEPTSFHRQYYNYNGYYKTNEYKVDGYPTNIIFGYTLLAINPGGRITQDQANKVGEEILGAIAPLKNLFVGIGPPGLSTPVVFDKGSTEEVMAMVPPSMRPFAQPGFLQFRAYNASGYPTAFCPGIKLISLYPEYACVGSISNSLENHGTCGDYAGWEGLSTDAIKSNDASGFAHAHNDISSTILIFQR